MEDEKKKPEQEIENKKDKKKTFTKWGYIIILGHILAFIFIIIPKIKEEWEEKNYLESQREALVQLRTGEDDDSKTQPWNTEIKSLTYERVGGDNRTYITSVFARDDGYIDFIDRGYEWSNLPSYVLTRINKENGHGIMYSYNLDLMDIEDLRKYESFPVSLKEDGSDHYSLRIKESESLINFLNDEDLILDFIKASPEIIKTNESYIVLGDLDNSKFILTIDDLFENKSHSISDKRVLNYGLVFSEHSGRLRSIFYHTSSEFGIDVNEFNDLNYNASFDGESYFEWLDNYLIEDGKEPRDTEKINLNFDEYEDYLNESIERTEENATLEESDESSDE